jgi:hypothetical protein
MLMPQHSTSQDNIAAAHMHIFGTSNILRQRQYKADQEPEQKAHILDPMNANSTIKALR